MLKPRLVRPSIVYKKSFMEALCEFEADKSIWKNEPKYLDVAKDFSMFVRNLLNKKNSKSLPKGIVPDSFFWLVRGNHYLGRVSIRHRLN